jgi:AcrR family transcriptional regulator
VSGPNGPLTHSSDAMEILLWHPPSARARGPKRSLTLAQIAATTVQIADAEGLRAVSMQRVAAALDVTKMALYRYVPGKDALLAIAVEEAVEEAPREAEVPPGWRPGLDAWARQLRAVWQRHPWLPRATMGDRTMGPREVAWIECALGILADTGLSAAERLDAVLVLCGHVRNSSASDAAGTQPWTVTSTYATVLQLQMQKRGDAYPHLLGTLAEVRDHAHPAATNDRGWELGLHLLLDGLQTAINARPAT